MKKIMSGLPALTVFIGLLVGCAAVYGEQVPNPPHHSQTDVKEVEIISRAASGTSSVGPKSTLRVGAAKVRIEIPENFFPYSAWGPRYLTGVRDDLYVRVIMLANKGTGALFVSIETGDLSDEWITPMSEMTGIPECNIYLSATHTHSAPFISKSYFELALKDVDKSRAYAENAYAALKEAIQEAMADMRPAEVSYGTGTCDINVNRDYKYTGNSNQVTVPYITAPNPQGVCDKTVGVMKFIDMSGAPIAYFINYSIHSTVMFAAYTRDNGMEMTGDIAGATSRYVEERCGEGCVAMYTMACAADTMPRYVANYQVFDSEGNFTTVDASAAGFTLVDLQAMELGTEVLRVGAGMTEFASEIEIAGTTRNITVPGKKKGGIVEAMNASKDYAVTYEDADPVELRLGLLMIDGVAFVGIPAEIPNTVGLNIKDMLRGLGCENSLCVSQCNGSVSYISDDDGYARLKFSAKASRCKPGADRAIVDEVDNMYKTLAQR